MACVLTTKEVDSLLVHIFIGYWYLQLMGTYTPEYIVCYTMLYNAHSFTISSTYVHMYICCTSAHI